MSDDAAARSAAQFLSAAAKHWVHTEAVANCPHCNAAFLARWALDVLGPEPEHEKPPGPPDPPQRISGKAGDQP